MAIEPTLFCDGILDASVTAGVARLTLAQAGADGKLFVSHPALWTMGWLTRRA
jgi:hypothetical protein